MPISKHLQNNWKNVQENKEQLDNCQDYPVLSGLEESWEVLDNFYDGIIERHEPEKQNVASNPLKSFLHHVNSGFYPPPEVLMTIANCFEHYMNAKGEAGLEDVFFGIDPKKGIGNYSAQVNRISQFKRFSMIESMEEFSVKRTKAKKRSQQELLNDLLLSDIRKDILDDDSFLRGYRRWKISLNEHFENKSKEEIEHFLNLFEGVANSV